MEIAIRPARPSDEREAIQIIKAAYARWRADVEDLPDVTDGVGESIAAGHVWLAGRGGRVAGILVAARHRDAFHIQNLAVAPDDSGFGVGSALMRHGELVARSLGFNEMHLATHREMERNVDFYRRLGWQVTGHSGSKILMVRRLPSPSEDS